MGMGIDKAVIIDAAARMADEEGITNITLKSLAEKLGVKSPSLYKHINGLDELNKELMLYGWDLLEKEIMKAAIGKAKDDALIALCYTFRNFVALHRGLFEAMQWYNMYQTNEHLQATEGLISVIFQVLDAYDLTEEQKVHIVRTLRGFLQGFSTIECHNGFGNSLSVDDTFDFSIKIFLNGIHNLQRENEK